MGEIHNGRIHPRVIYVGAIHELPLQERMNKESHSTESVQIPNWRDRRKMLLPKIIGYFKMNSAKEINRIERLSGLSLWQRNYYEHIIRNEGELIQIRRYIKNNPRRWLDGENNPINLK
jgi:putative transposase